MTMNGDLDRLLSAAMHSDDRQGEWRPDQSTARARLQTVMRTQGVARHEVHPRKRWSGVPQFVAVAAAAALVVTITVVAEPPDAETGPATGGQELVLLPTQGSGAIPGTIRADFYDVITDELPLVTDRQVPKPIVIECFYIDETHSMDPHWVRLVEPEGASISVMDVLTAEAPIPQCENPALLSRP